jgi:hypothetical protein
LTRIFVALLYPCRQITPFILHSSLPSERKVYLWQKFFV